MMKKYLVSLIAAATLTTASPAFADPTFESVAQNYETMIYNLIHYQIPQMLVNWGIIDANTLNQFMPVLNQAEQDNRNFVTQGPGSASAQPVSIINALLNKLVEGPAQAAPQTTNQYQYQYPATDTNQYPAAPASTNYHDDSY